MAVGLRTRILSVAVLALVFVSGAVVGVAVDRRRSAESSASGEAVAEAEGAEPDEDERRGRMLYEQVDGLRPEQETRIDSVLRHHRSARRALDEDFKDDWQALRDHRERVGDAYFPRYWAIVDSTRAAIRAIFDTSQALQYDSLTAEYDRRRRDEERSDDSGR